MDKKMLKEFIVVDIKEEWLGLSKQLKGSKMSYLVAIERKVIEKVDTLILNFFDINKSVIKYRLFLNKTDYITQDLTNSPCKWKTGALKNVLSWSWYEYTILADSVSTNNLSEFFGQPDVTLEIVNDLQENIMANRLADRHRKIKDRIDKKMQEVPRLPNNFKRWINDTALFDSRYIYYEYKARKVLDGYCTHCDTDVKVDRVNIKHNGEGICPKCKSPITYKAMGKSRNIVDTREVALIQKAGDNLVVRYFTATKEYGYNYRNPKLTYIELCRDFYDSKGNIEQYEWGAFKQTLEVRWRKATNSSGLYGTTMYDYESTVLFDKNLDEVLEGSIWQYSAIKKFATHKNCFMFPVWSYLKRFIDYPQIEYLVKLKLYNITSSVIYYNPYMYKNDINLTGSNIYEVLGINSKEELLTAKKMNATLREFRVIKKAAALRINISDEHIRFIAEYLTSDRVFKLLNHTTLHKAIQYIKSQTNNPDHYNDVLNDWIDYITDCRLLKYDLTNDMVLFPRSLREEHRITNDLVAEGNVNLYNSAIMDMYEELSKMFAWKYKGYEILVPQNGDEIVAEGTKLRHCVKSYVSRVAKRDTIILFMRKREDISIPYYTLEIDPIDYSIVQCRGMKNASMTDDVEKLVDRFKKDKLINNNYIMAA